MKENRTAQGHTAGKTRDVNSKRVFRDPVLCSQFLRDNVNIPALKNIRPEDIEDVTERYQTYLGVEFQSDTVKKICVRDDDGKEREEPLYLISLIEHKSDVDYNVAMQILKYMVWDSIAFMPELDFGFMKNQMMKIHQSLIYALLYGAIQQKNLSSAAGGKKVFPDERSAAEAFPG